VKIEIRSRGAARARAGWTLLEIMISTVILLVVLMGFSYGLVSATSLERVTREQGQAREAARAQIELLRALPLEEVLERYDDLPGNDPEGGSSPGASFDVPGLTPRPGAEAVGTIVFPLSEEGELREDLERAELGMPRDLTGEGELDDLDHSGDYRMLPVLVRLEWRGAGGDCRLEMATALKRMRP